MQASSEPRVLSYDPFAGEKIVAENLSFEDFLHQFDGQHVEWYQGKVINVMPSGLRHQDIQAFFILLFSFYFQMKPVGRFIQAPFTMNAGDHLPKREPDMMIILAQNFHRIKNTYVDGAADIAIEIVSPESEIRDYADKLQEFEIAGVPEYWLVDPFRQVANIYVLGADKRYLRANLDVKGNLVSSVLTNFVLNPAVLWQETLPQGTDVLALVQQMFGD